MNEVVGSIAGQQPQYISGRIQKLERPKYWDNVQAILGKIGKESIKRRIALFDIDKLELDIALGARKLLGNLLIDNVRQASVGAATFYVWVQGIVDEMQTRYSDMIGLVAPRTHLMGGQGNPLQLVLDVNEYMALHDI